MIKAADMGKPNPCSHVDKYATDQDGALCGQARRLRRYGSTGVALTETLPGSRF